MDNKVKKEIEYMMDNREELYEDIRNQIQLLMVGSKVPEPLFYILLMEVCMKKMSQHVSKDIYFETIENSANYVLYDEKKTN